ncbi:MAG: hypothetical protein PHU51_04555, partial [Candidatus Nanoarchaeia archaeon]|nr:hypothetical protein [Candidatus Nanoarchaeia archaeon]
MGELKENPNANRDLIIAVIVLFGLWGYKHFEENPIDWSAVARVIILSLLCLLFLTGIIIAIISIYRHKKQKKEEFENFLNKLRLIKETKLYSMEQISQLDEDLKELYDSPHYEKYCDEISKISDNLLKVYGELKKEEEKEKEKSRRWSQEFNLEHYFVAHSTNELPKWAKNYDKDIIKSVTEEYNKKYRKEKVEEIDEYEGKKFYFAKDLTPKEREELIELYGFKNYPFVNFDGNFGNQLFIKNTNSHESDYHFAMKHMFGSLDFGNPMMEYSYKSMVVDVMFTLGKKRIALEIETGSNKELFVEEKIKYLNKNYDKWIILTSRKNKK